MDLKKNDKVKAETIGELSQDGKSSKSKKKVEEDDEYDDDDDWDDDWANEDWDSMDEEDDEEEDDEKEDKVEEKKTKKTNCLSCYLLLTPILLKKKQKRLLPKKPMKKIGASGTMTILGTETLIVSG